MYVQIDSSVNNIYGSRVRTDYPLIIGCKVTTKNPIIQIKVYFAVIFLLRARQYHTFGMYCLTLRELQIFLDTFHADNILTFNISGIVIDNCFVYRFSFYIENSIRSEKLRSRF